MSVIIWVRCSSRPLIVIVNVLGIIGLCLCALLLVLLGFRACDRWGRGQSEQKLRGVYCIRGMYLEQQTGDCLRAWCCVEVQEGGGDGRTDSLSRSQEAVNISASVAGALPPCQAGACDD